MSEGKFITFEGGEGSGKSTQATLLSARLKAVLGTEPLITREPGGSPFAEKLRAILLSPECGSRAALAEALVFYAARADHLEAAIRPALESGRWVICDRFSDSTRVYQGHAGKLDQRVIDALEMLVTKATVPDLTVVIDVPAEVGLARAAMRRLTAPVAQAAASTGCGNAARGGAIAGLVPDRFEGRDMDYHRRLREGFLAIAAKEPKRCIVVDGQQAPEEVAEAVWSAVQSRLLPAKA